MVQGILVSYRIMLWLFLDNMLAKCLRIVERIGVGTWRRPTVLLEECTYKPLGKNIDDVIYELGMISPIRQKMHIKIKVSV